MSAGAPGRHSMSGAPMSPPPASGGPMSDERGAAIQLAIRLAGRPGFHDQPMRDAARDELAALLSVLTQHEEALRFACRELAAWRYEYSALPHLYVSAEADVDDTVEEFLEKARGFPAEGSVEVPE